MPPSSRYESIELIGSGAMADVFLANDTKLGRQVALKKIHAHLLKKPGLKERFLSEATTLASLSHKNIVTIHDVVVEETPFLVMEYIQGENLDDLLKRGLKLRGLVLLELIRQILRGMHYAHGKNVIHRDIKPSNIMVTGSGLIKLTDFGIAHVFQGQALTMTGQFMGTPDYSSPEIIQGEKVTTKSDVFSLCCLMYECLTGFSPFEGKSTHETLQNICNQEPTPVSKFNNKSLSFTQEILNRGFEKDPGKRISAEKMLEDIEAFQKYLNLTSGKTRIGNWLEDPESSERNESLDLYQRFGELADYEDRKGNKIKYHKQKHEQQKFSPGFNQDEDPLKGAVKSNRSVKVLSLAMGVCLLLYLLLFFLSKSDKPAPGSLQGDKAAIPEPLINMDAAGEDSVVDSLVTGSSVTEGAGVDTVVLNKKSSPSAPPKKILSGKKSEKAAPAQAKRIKKLAYIRVKSRPPFVNVKINGRFMGRTPFKMPLGLAPGTYSLSLSKKGWKPLQEKIELKSGDTLIFMRELNSEL